MTHQSETHMAESRKAEKKDNDIMVWILAAAAILLIINQWQISSVMTMLGPQTSSGSMMTRLFSGGSADLSGVDVNQIQSTAQALDALYPLEDIKTADDAMRIMVPTGMPSYGQAMGVTFDDPVTSLSRLALWHQKLDGTLTPDQKARFVNLAAQPRGVSCEYCCGIGPVGATPDGRSRCGCQHNPALLGLTMWLIQNTDMGDAEILLEVMKWKTLFFPKDMVGLALQIAGGDASVLANVPGMVGGC